MRVAMEHGCLPYGNAKARAVAWNLPDPVPQHREPIYTPRLDLIPTYPTGGSHGRRPRVPPAGATRRAERRGFDRISGFVQMRFPDRS